MRTFAGVKGEDRFGLANRFAVEIQGTIEGTFTECSGLGASMRFDKYEEGGGNATTLKLPGRVDYTNVVLKHGEATSFQLYNWFLSVLRNETGQIRKDVTIKLMTWDLTTLREWHFSAAFPVKWTGPTLQATSNTIAIETIELAHDGFVDLGPVKKSS